jgi:hypothetical protein
LYTTLAQVVTSEKSFTGFTSGSGNKIDPVRTNGYDFELHTIVGGCVCCSADLRQGCKTPAVLLYL